MAERGGLGGRLFRLIPSVVGAILVLMMQGGPADIASNLNKWTKDFGVTFSEGDAKLIFWGAVALILVGLVWFFAGICVRGVRALGRRYEFRSPIKLRDRASALLGTPPAPDRAEVPVSARLRKSKGVLKADGFWFFPDRRALTAETISLNDRLKDATNADLLLVIADNFVSAHENVGKARRLLLPDYNAPDFKTYLASRTDRTDFQRVKTVAEIALSKGVGEVKFTRDFLFRTMILVDTDKDSGWVHLEDAFPYVEGENRGAFTIRKKNFPDLVAHYRGVFELLWRDAKVKLDED